MIALVPVPTAATNDLIPIWLPFIERIAERGRMSVKLLEDQVASGEVSLCIAWDAEQKRPKALAGIRVIERGAANVAEIVWLTGSDKDVWLPLFDDLEMFCRDHLGCPHMKATARPGWKKLLEQRGYRMTHVVMERDAG